MTNEEFGRMVLPLCHVAIVRRAVMKSAQSIGQLCGAEVGFIDAIRDRHTKSAADLTFLKAIDRAMSQPRIKEGGK